MAKFRLCAFMYLVLQYFNSIEELKKLLGSKVIVSNF